MMDSILTSVKKLLGVGEEYTHFDADIIMHINSVIFVLTQIGIGPVDGFSITSKDQTWNDFLQGRINIESVKSYVYLKVRLLFDPPSNSFLVEAIERQISEYEWRLNITSS